LGTAAWSVLIEVSEIYEREKQECHASLQSLEYYDNEILNAFEKYSCNECGSELIFSSTREGEAINADYICKSCEKRLTYEELVGEAISEHYSWDVYLSHTDGGESPLADCPECGGDYLYERGVCALCGHSAEHVCQRCHSRIMPEELSTAPFCGYCAYVMYKDD